ncbi:MAG: hypothetical protein WED85_13645 [Dehalococcoidia bacterium]
MTVRIRQIVWILVSGLVLGGAVGVVFAFILAPDDAPLPASDKAQAGLPISNPGEGSVGFPSDLDSLELPPGDLAVDSAGTLWVPLFTGGDSGHRLSRYNPQSPEIKSYALPDSPASNLFGFIESAPDGRLVLAYGDIVTVFDPEADAFLTVSLPPTGDAEALPIPAEGTWVTDLSISPSGEAYVSRMNVSAIAVVDLGAMKVVDEIPVPEGFGPVYGIEATTNGLYITNWLGTASAGARTAIISAGEYKELAGGSLEILGLDGNSLVIARNHGLIQFIDPTTDDIRREVQAERGDAIYRIVASNDRVWVAGRDSGMILELTLTGESLSQRELPADVVKGESISCPIEVECNEDIVISRTRVEGLAVAPDGTLYFSDGTKNRIGVIQPTALD